METPPRSQGCWHLPAGAGNDWLCIDIPRGLRLRLDKLPVTRSRNQSSGAIGSGTSVAEGRKLMTAEDRADGDMIREVRQRGRFVDGLESALVVIGWLIPIHSIRVGMYTWFSSIRLRFECLSL